MYWRVTFTLWLLHTLHCDVISILFNLLQTIVKWRFWRTACLWLNSAATVSSTLCLSALLSHKTDISRFNEYCEIRYLTGALLNKRRLHHYKRQDKYNLNWTVNTCRSHWYMFRGHFHLLWVNYLFLRSRVHGPCSEFFHVRRTTT